MWYIYDDSSDEWFTVGSYGQPMFKTRDDQIRYIKYISNVRYDMYRINPNYLRPVKG